MEQFITFFSEHLELCCSAVLAITSTISLIVATFRKTKFFRIQDFFIYLSTLCSAVESVFGDSSAGPSKLDLVLRQAREYNTSNHLGLSDEEIISMIESILAAPEKNKK